LPDAILFQALPRSCRLVFLALALFGLTALAVLDASN
jgi:hypothetical protein